ncbi:MAG: lipid-A-disaccharide synthase [Betaproteobacteria bacterium]|nr:lipid-A-disaccharide synthase [Betaproteobacteria bacterium]MBK9609585.1 lipid-A-disaccharide synthase [Betaproteobacteria bacterium]
MRIAIVAGEASGDLLGAELIRAVRARRSDLEFYGVGGPKMQAAGCDILEASSALAVRGLTEVLRHLPRLFRLRSQLARRFAADRPALFIGIDAPDFNLGLEKKLKRRGLRTIHYVSPSVWAWREERIKTMGAAADHVLALFPFEPALYAKAGVAATYVGHPLADAAPLLSQRAARRAQRQFAREQPVVALLPGSRTSELEMHADLFIGVARKFHAAHPDAHFLVPLVNRETRMQFENALYRVGAEKLPLTLLYGHADDAFTTADVALVASGTATLEAALYRCPHVIAYRVGGLTARWVRRRLRVPWVGLPNVLAGQFIVPEFLQEDANVDNLAQALLNLYADTLVRDELAELFSRLHHALRQGSAERAAAVVLAALGAAGQT